jgi:tetratricopeptide (TPR) repeat protein
MKYTLAILFSLYSGILLCQKGFMGYENLSNRAEIVEGEIVLDSLILQLLRFPDQLVNIPQVSIVLACIEVTAEGEILRIFSLNDSDILFLSEINRVVSKSNFSWKTENSDTGYFILPIEFRNVVEEEYETDYYFKPKYIHNPIICFSTYPTDLLPPDTILINSYENYLHQHKYNKAMNELDILINRQPFKEIYYIKKIRLYTYMGKIEEAILEQKKAEEIFRLD